MRLGIVSDTHGHVPNTRAAIQILAAMEVDEVIHCGDIDTAEIIDQFAKWPTHFVFGNVDHPLETLRATIEAAAHATCHGGFGELEREGIRIAFLHGHNDRQLFEATNSGNYHLVLHGHTHVAKQEQVGDTIVLNPGAMYRAAKHTIAIADLPALEIQHLTVS